MKDYQRGVFVGFVIMAAGSEIRAVIQAEDKAAAALMAVLCMAYWIAVARLIAWLMQKGEP